MPAKSSIDQYGSVAIAIHWLSALLIVALLGSGFTAGGAEDIAKKAEILRIHIPLGLAVLFLTVLRIFWWFFADRKPVSIHMPVWQDRASKAVHFLFYIFILGMVGSGIGMMVLSDAGPIIFGVVKAVLPDFWDFKPRLPHGIGGRLTLLLFIFHAGAALYHQFVTRDELLRRMWFHRSEN